MRLRRSALAALLTAGILVPGVSVAATAFAASSPAAAHPAAGFKHTPKPVKTAKPARPLPFSASGTVTAVDAAGGTITLTAKGGTKDVRRRTVTVSVAAGARVVVNEARATLAEVAAGQRIAVVGTRTGTVYTASRVRARGAAVTPAPSPTAEPVETTEPVEPTEPAETPEPVETTHAGSHGDEQAD